MNYLYENEPCYKITGPNAEYVRNDQLQYFLEETKNILIDSKCIYNEIPENHLIEIVKHCILTHIPDSMKDFGSYKGYAIFGLDNQIKQRIRNLIRIELDHYTC